jgi:predicted phage tail protein
MAADGQWNFRGVSWTLRFGWPDQDPVPGFAAAEETIPIGQVLHFSNPIIQTVNSTTATAIRVTVQVHCSIPIRRPATSIPATPRS